MAEKYNQQAQECPLAPPSMPRSDEENTRNHTNHESQNQTKRSRRIRLLASMALLASALAAALAAALVIALVFARVTTPRVRLVDVELAGVPNSSNLRLAGRVAVRNRNQGRYEFDSVLATVRTADGTSVGQFVIHGGRVRARSTTRVYVIADLGGLLVPNAGESDLRVESRLRGKVRVLGVFWRNRSARLYCTMTFGLPTNAVWNLRCR